MRWVSFLHDGRPQVGVIQGDSVIPLAGIDAIGAGAGTAELRAAQPEPDRAVRRADVRLLPASPAPRKVLCVGLNYSGHITETGRETPTYPVLFAKYASSLISATDAIRLPPESLQVDYEGELAVVIGKPGRRICRDRALDHVLGYTVANDVTMRDFQYKTHQWIQGKAWDASTPIGPEIVSPDEVDLPSSGIRTVLNGETVQHSDLSHLIFDIPALIATISEFAALEAGDVILTGTPSGVGYRRDPQRFLQPGDQIAVEIDGIGRIDSSVQAE